MAGNQRCRGAFRVGLCLAGLCLAVLLAGAALPEMTGGSVTVRAAEPQLPSHADLSWYPDSAGQRQKIGSISDWERRREDILKQMQTVMGPVPRPATPVPLDLKVEDESTLDNGLVRRKVSYQSDSTERRVRAWLFLPAGGAAKRPAVLCLHQTTGIGKDEPAGLGGNPNLHYALHLASRGYVTLAPDYPSFGEYPYGFPAEDGYISGTMKAVYDNMRALDALESLEGVDAARIGCIGHSLGGHNTMFTAAFDPRIRVLVSNCGFTRFHKYYGGRLKGWTSARYMPLIDSRHGNDPDQVPFDFPEIVASFAPRPFLASAPVGDSNFEVFGVKDCMAAARPVYELYGAAEHVQANYPECGHDFPEDVRDVAYRFFDRYLRDAKPAEAE